MYDLSISTSTLIMYLTTSTNVLHPKPDTCRDHLNLLKFPMTFHYNAMNFKFGKPMKVHTNGLHQNCPVVNKTKELQSRAGMNIEIYFRIFASKMFEHSKLRC